MIYFAYGSNLDEVQMRVRCPEHRVLATAVLPGHRLVFLGHSESWGGGVASVVRDFAHDVRGLLYDIQPTDLENLDRYEGYPHCYRREALQVVDEMGRRRRAEVYLCNGSVQAAPSYAYAECLLEAYEHHGFDVTPLLDALNAASGERRWRRPRCWLEEQEMDDDVEVFRW